MVKRERLRKERVYLVEYSANERECMKDADNNENIDNRNAFPTTHHFSHC